MHSETVLIAGICGSVAASLVIWLALQGSLRALMDQMCERSGGNDFWTRYTLLMLMLAPLALVLMFLPEHYTDVTQVVRRLLLVIVLSQFAAYALIGRSLIKTVRTRMAPETTSASTAGSGA
jgi:hypothetical protein